MKFLTLLIIFLSLSLFSASKAQNQAKLIQSLQKQLSEKDDYIQLLEAFIKKNLFQDEIPPAESQHSLKSFLEMSEKSDLKAKSKAGPVLKAMLFGFPNPRAYTFGSQNAKGDSKDNYQNLKICERGCIVA